MRGRPNLVGEHDLQVRLIPAGAGQTKAIGALAKFNGAHPRRCGADASSSRTWSSAHGSSPQVRGRQCCLRHVRHHERLIPAGAGQTPTAAYSSTGRKAHPRRCGADWAGALSSRTSPGSSPQVRGRRVLGHVRCRNAGLIPAGAGQTSEMKCLALMLRAHPRRCGADLQAAADEIQAAGSSPQVRGRLDSAVSASAAARLIPAGAGQTSPNPENNRGSGAHPRRCGADQQFQARRFYPSGSSPQVRGRPLATSNVALAEGPLETTPLSHPECTPRVRGVVKPPFYYGSSLLGKVGSRIILYEKIPSAVVPLNSKKAAVRILSLYARC